MLANKIWWKKFISHGWAMRATNSPGKKATFTRDANTRQINSIRVLHQGAKKIQHIVRIKGPSINNFGIPSPLIF